MRPLLLTRFVFPRRAYVISDSMKSAFVLLVALVAVATAAEPAAAPAVCGGHGMKGPDGKCMCKGRWEGENCDIGECERFEHAG